MSTYKRKLEALEKAAGGSSPPKQQENNQKSFLHESILIDSCEVEKFKSMTSNLESQLQSSDIMILDLEKNYGQAKADLALANEKIKELQDKLLKFQAIQNGSQSISPNSQRLLSISNELIDSFSESNTPPKKEVKKPVSPPRARHTPSIKRSVSNYKLFLTAQWSCLGELSSGRQQRRSSLRWLSSQK